MSARHDTLIASAGYAGAIMAERLGRLGRCQYPDMDQVGAQALSTFENLQPRLGACPT